MDNQSSVVQKMKVVKSETIIEKSEFTLEIENFIECEEDIVTAKVKLQNVEAEWWLKIGKQNLCDVFELHFCFAPSSGYSLDLDNCKFNITVKTYDSNNISYSVEDSPLPSWLEMSKLKDSQPLDLNKQYFDKPDLLLNVTFMIKRFDYSLVRQKFFNPIAINREIISSMLNNPTFADFTFVVKSEEFQVHKNVLASVSPVFKRMFLSKLKEGRTNVCKVDQIEPKIFASLLQFIYEAKLPDNFEKDAKNIYKAAHYYGLDQLKEICEQEVRSQLSPETAVELYEMASTFDLAELKKEAWHIIKRDVLKIYFHIKGEPLSPEAVQEIIAYKQTDQKYWKTLEKVPELKKVEGEPVEEKKEE